MPYETGSTTGWADLQSRIKTFLLANGWTNPGAGNILATGSIYFDLTAAADNLSITGGQGESAGALTLPAPYNPKISDAHPDIPAVAWPATYHLFAHTSPAHFLCVFNFNVEYIQWITAGDLQKHGTWNGGQYIGASFGRGFDTGQINSSFQTSWAGLVTNGSVKTGCGLGLWWAAQTRVAPYDYQTNMHMVCDVDGAVGDWLDNRYDASSYPNARAFDGARMTADIRGRGPNTFNGQMVLDPVKVSMGRPDNKRSYLGDPVHVRYANILNQGIADIVTIGADRWMVFPLLRKVVTSTPALVNESGGASGFNSEHLGFAVAYDGP